MDKKLFFQELKNKILKNVELVYSKDLDSKISALKNLEEFISVLKKELVSKLGEDKYNQKPLAKKNITAQDIKNVEKFGKDNGYPSMVLKRKDGKVVKYLGSGEDKWLEMLSMMALKSPYNENLIDLVLAVEDDDRYEEKKTNTS